MELIMTPAIVTNDIETIVVGMAEMQVKRYPHAVLSCLGLGSCIALCIYDPVNKMGGIVHIVLPNSENKQDISPTKYADTAVPSLLNEMIKQGGARSRFIVKLVGGAQLSLTPGLDSVFKTGERNLKETEAALAKERIPVAATDVGGNKGRTIHFFLDTGKIIVKSAGSEIKEL
jgi:chemotaxis protein CheD